MHLGTFSSNGLPVIVSDKGFGVAFILEDNSKELFDLIIGLYFPPPI